MEEEDFKKLPVEERCVHKLWKARVSGYEEVAKTFRQLDDEKSPEFGKYLGLVKKFVTDSNAMGQERGLEATLAYVENYAHAGRTVSEVMSGVVTKCIAAPKTRTRELALQLTLTYVEIERQEHVMEELIKGMEQKNPKIVAGCVSAATLALREFGSKIVGVKPLVKKIGPLFGDRDKGVRDEAKAMVVEIYRWIGGALRSQLGGLQPVQVTELETEFAKMEGQKAVPVRYVRSQQQKQQALTVEAEEVDGGGSEEEAQADDPAPMDPYDLADPVDILSRLPKDFYEKLEAKKWQERKEAVEALEALTKTPKLENGDYGDVVRALKRIIEKDSNVIVVAIAGRCLAGLANGLRKKFHPYSGACVSSLLEKFKEKKQNVVVAMREAIDAIYATTTLEAIMEDVVEALGNKNPSIKTETALFLSRSFAKTQPAVFNKKILKAITQALLKNVNEPDPGVRDSSSESIGTLMKLVGEKAIAPFLVELEKDNLKMSKIKEFCEKAEITVAVPKPKKERPATAPVVAAKAAVAKPAAKAPRSAPQSGAAAKKKTGDGGAPASKMAARGAAARNSVYDQIDEDETGSTDNNEGSSDNKGDSAARVDISPQITEALLAEMEDKNWKVRSEALAKLSALIQEAKNIKPSLGDLPQALTHRLSDINTKIAQTALNICEMLAKAMGPQCKQFVKVFFPCFLQHLGDNKSWMRSAARENLNVYGEHGGYKEFFENETIADALKSGSPFLRIELWAWLSEILPKVKSVSKDELNACIPHLYSNVEDRNSDVRKNAQEAVLGFMIHLGYENMAKQTEKLKPGSKANVMATLEKVRPNLPAKPLPPKKAVPDKQQKVVVKGTKPVANARNAVKPKGSAASVKSGASGGSKKEEDVDISPLLEENNQKNQRSIDEAKLKVLKWNFTTPREEFVDLLKDQMSTANVNTTLISNMFHADFRYHIRALESLTEDLADNFQALVCNLDLVLKWLTLRFFDTNPSVLLKSLDYLNVVFGMLKDIKYRMMDNEAASFLPYLVGKVGDPKDTVRNGVKGLLNESCSIYPINKTSVYVMDGIKSKNARQRAECLDVMSGFIARCGITVCNPTPTACLKEVAKQISDRDNGVRNAALNCVVQAYFIVGEKVYKMIGNISDKDISLLEERIKRSNRQSMLKQLDVAVPKENDVMQEVPQQNPSNGRVEVEQEDEMEEEEEEPEVNLPPVLPPKHRSPSTYDQQPPQPIGPFRLDPELLQKLDEMKPTFSMVHIQKIDTSFLNDTVNIPSLKPGDSSPAATATPTRAAAPRSPARSSGDSPAMPNSNSNISSGIRFGGQTLESFGGVKAEDPAFLAYMGQMVSKDLAEAVEGLNNVITHLQTIDGGVAGRCEDEFLGACVTQLRNLKGMDPMRDAVVARTYKTILTAVDSFYRRGFGQKANVPVLKDVIDEFLTVLVDGKLEDIPSGDAYVRVINLHCVKIIEKSDHTKIICALVQLIAENIRNNRSDRHTDLVMKCHWRTLKLMPGWGENIDFDHVLLEVHKFLKEFPSQWWKAKPLDTPLRTIKTILHTSVKIKGGSIMLHMGKVAAPHESEMEMYIIRLLKTLNVDAPSKPVTSQALLSRANHTMLTEIFQKIGDKNETKQGLDMLYDFMKQHAEADVEPFLKKSSKFFQDYIEKGLKEIELDRQMKKSTSEKVVEKVAATMAPSPQLEVDSRGPEYWMEKLDILKKMRTPDEPS